MENSRWIISELRRVDEKMDEREKLVETRFRSHEDALTLAKVEMERRLEATKSELTIIVGNVLAKIDSLQGTSAINVGSKKWTDYLLLAIIAALISVAVRFLVK